MGEVHSWRTKRSIDDAFVEEKAYKQAGASKDEVKWPGLLGFIV